MGIGIHSGNVIFGKMGYKHAKNLTAVGDAVNTASRLESLTKEFKCQLIYFKNTYEHSDYQFKSSRGRLSKNYRKGMKCWM